MPYDNSDQELSDIAYGILLRDSHPAEVYVGEYGPTSPSFHKARVHKVLLPFKLNYPVVYISVIPVRGERLPGPTDEGAIAYRVHLHSEGVNPTLSLTGVLGVHWIPDLQMYYGAAFMLASRLAEHYNLVRINISDFRPVDYAYDLFEREIYDALTASRR